MSLCLTHIFLTRRGHGKLINYSFNKIEYLVSILKNIFINKKSWNNIFNFQQFKKILI